MKFLTEFYFDTFERAMNMHSKLFEIIRKNGYVTYADILKLNLCEPIYGSIPDLYNKMGWANLFEAKVVDTTLILPPITNIENKIKYVKENRNERTNNKKS